MASEVRTLTVIQASLKFPACEKVPRVKCKNIYQVLEAAPGHQATAHVEFLARNGGQAASIVPASSSGYISWAEQRSRKLAQV